MRVVESTVVYRNPYPNHRPETFAGTTLAWAGREAAMPSLLSAFRSGSAKMSPDGRVRLRASEDLGRTWRDEPSPFAAVPGDASQSGPHLGGSAHGTAARSTP